MIILFLGAPGSGKGTISNFLKNKYGIIHISTGDLFRKIMTQNNELAQKIKKEVSLGKLISDSLTNDLVKQELSKYDLNKQKIILDGYPRNIFQFEFLKSFAKIDFAFDIYIPYELMLKRLLGRRFCPKCNEIYNIYFKKPNVESICDKCGTTLIQRKDDNENVIKTRLDQYNASNTKLVQACKQMKIYYQINNENINSSTNEIANICNF